MMSRMLSRGTAALVAAGGARFAYQAARDPLHVVWDLDSTLISSQLLPDAERFASRDYFDQFDDFPPAAAGGPHNTRTFHRPWAALALGALDVFAVQHVFTAAQASYTANVLAELDPARARFRRVLTRDDAWAGGENPRAKDLTHLVREDELRRVVFFDDRLRNFAPQPRNGVLVKPFEDPSRPDAEMLRLLAICALCTVADDVRPVLRMFQSPAYRAKYQLE